MARKIRKDITVGGLEKKLKLAPGSIKNLDGRDARSDKKLDTLQKEAAKAAKKTTKKSPVKRATTKVSKPNPVTADQKTASLRKVKSIPKATSKLSKKVSAAIKKTIKK